MSFQVKLNSVDISARIVSGPTIHKNDVLHGKISPNECSFDIDNTNLAYTVSNLDIEGQLVEVWVNSIKQFTGYAEKPTLTRNGRTVHVQAFDKMKQLQKLKCQDKMFIGSTADAILTWLVETCGGIGLGSRNLDSIVVASGVGTTQAIVGYALYSIKDKLTDKLQEIVDSVGGTMWFDESGVLQFRAGFAATWSTSTVGTITVSKLKDIDSLQWLPSEGDRVIVKSKNRSVKTSKEPIFTWAGTVTPDGLPTGKDENGNAITDDQWRAKFDSPAIDVDDYATVNAAKQFDSGLSLNETVYNSNFDTGALKYPDFMYLQIDNSSGTDKNVTKLVIEGKPVVENYLEVIYDAGSFDVEREVSNDLISSKVWASSLAKWLYENGNGKFEAVIPLADFSLGLGWSVGDKVNIVDASTGLSHRAWVREIDIDYRNRNMTVTLRSDRASAFVYTPPPGSTTGPGTNIPYDPQFGDGSAPATPTGLALSTFFSDGKTYVKATWSANTETDIKGYEVAWSYDGVNWYNSGLTSETSLVIEVKAGVTIYVKVKAKDIEGFESSWTSSQSITSAKDTTIPDNLSSISAAGGYDLIYVSWVHTKPSDFSHYIVQRAPSPYSSWSEVAIVQSKEFIDKSATAGTYYKYRVKAVDIYGNEAASWVTTSSGVTCSSISSELLELDGRLSNLSFSDILGYLNSGQIDDDTIIARMILAGEIKTLHMDVDEIVGNSAWFGKIVANHIATNAITADKILAGSVTANKLEALLKIASGKAIQAGPDNDNYTMLSSGFERTKEFLAKVYTVELKLRFLYSYSGLGFYIKYAFYDKTAWDGYYSGTSNFRIQATSGDENTWQEITLRSNMPEFFNWGYQAVGTSLEDFRIALLIESDQGFKFSEADFFINGVHIGGLHTQSEWQNAENTLVSENTSYGPDDGGYMSCTVYYQDLSTAFGISESSTTLSKIVPTILNSGEVLFDGTETSKLVCFNLELAPSQYDVILIPVQQEVSKASWTPDTHTYKTYLDYRKAQESPYGWFWLDYYVEEYSSDPSVYHADSAGLTSTYQTLFVGGSTMISAEVSVFHGGYFNFFKQRVWHQYATAGARTVKAKVVLGITYIDWGDGSVSEIGTFGTVHIRNIIEYRSESTIKPIAGKINWILVQT